MKKFIWILIFGFLIVACAKEKLTFINKTFEKKILSPNKKDSAIAKVTVPIASNLKPVADSINKKLFSVAKEIIYFGEKPFVASDYNGLLSSFINSYTKLIKDFPEYNTPWKATIEAKVIYQSEKLVNIEVKHYSFTGGAHGYSGLRSVIIDLTTGKTIPNTALFYGLHNFKKLAEKKFRQKFNIPVKNSINSKGMWFENEKFSLPNSIFYTETGLLLYYNQYEIASYAEGPIELLITYKDIGKLLRIK